MDLDAGELQQAALAGRPDQVHGQTCTRNGQATTTNCRKRRLWRRRQHRLSANTGYQPRAYVAAVVVLAFEQQWWRRPEWLGRAAALAGTRGTVSTQGTRIIVRSTTSSPLLSLALLLPFLLFLFHFALSPSRSLNVRT